MEFLDSQQATKFDRPVRVVVSVAAFVVFFFRSSRFKLSLPSAGVGARSNLYRSVVAGGVASFGSA